ncbi:glycoside hydrolase family 15 protein [Plastoroseomonas hellenica]|uniref:glycoside hydrolase family 15 protein n=1 Tax=Plastoroseomonas hellenica TaxID=2687306 RepID=UPI001BA5A347|nr:glycoside hydrolase family 15 protein [Plastoroseomonas hellenica]MBR0646275.1 glycoside hydrolase family 15 protein [Plastoroseomonas hellenica]
MTAATEAAGGPLPIEDYGLIGDCTTAALVGRNGSIDWLCWPRFDSAACFAALLGRPEHGRWLIAPCGPEMRATRSYIGETMVLETLFETEEGDFAVIDFMPTGRVGSSVVRIVEGRRGRPRVRTHLTLRFDHGSSIPWVTRLPEGDGISAIAGPNLAVLRAAVPLHGEDFSTTAEFTVAPEDRFPFVLSYGPSHRPPPDAIDAEAALCDTLAFWRAWSKHCTCHGRWRKVVMRSLLTLKALTYAETGGIVAAPTTSLPEKLGGVRNWDYRFCWLRDATLTLVALMRGGYYEEAKAWRDWLQRSVAGSPSDIQIMYGIAGERRLAEWEVPWLPGYQGAAPVRIGNAASGQLQLDVWGEVMDALRLARDGGLASPGSAWALECGALRHLEAIWREPDDGIWEVRGGRRQFTHSKVMAWVAFDRMIRDAEKYGFEAPLERWRATREEIHRTVCELGYDAARGSFTQSFGSPELDASLLLIPAVGFLPIEDPRVAGTIAAIERELVTHGFVLRYRTESGADGLPAGEGVFLACSLWLADAYAMQGRWDDAYAMFHRVLSLRNDLGLLSEEYDPRAGRQVGNFPQAFSHLTLVSTAIGLGEHGPIRRSSERKAEGKPPESQSVSAKPS